MATVDLRPLPVTTAPARRLPQLLGGLVLYGTSMAMQIRATLGLNPWDVFHQGLARHLPLSFGLVTAVTGSRCSCCGSRCASARASGRWRT